MIPCEFPVGGFGMRPRLVSGYQQSQSFICLSRPVPKTNFPLEKSVESLQKGKKYEISQ